MKVEVQDIDSDFMDDRAQALAHLATLQRLKEQALQGNRAAMLRSIEQLMEAEGRALFNSKNSESDSASEPHA